MLSNPVLARELRGALRSPLALVLAALYLGVLATLVWWMWPQEGVYSIAARSSRSILLVVSVTQLLLAMLYAPAFAAHAVDMDIVADLTDADLQSIGVALLGDRKRLLKAIGEMRPVVPGDPPGTARAERRQERPAQHRLGTERGVLGPHVHDAHGGHGPVEDTPRQPQALVTAGFHMGGTFERRRRSAEDDERARNERDRKRGIRARDEVHPRGESPCVFVGTSFD